MDWWDIPIIPLSAADYKNCSEKERQQTMGYWGEDYQESDGYLDLFAEVMSPIKEHITEEIYMDDAVIEASGLLLDILKNSELYYQPERELVGAAIKRLSIILKHYDASSWKHPAKRIASIEELRSELKKLYAKENRFTTLGR